MLIEARYSFVAKIACRSQKIMVLTGLAGFVVANAVEKFGSELVKVGANLFHIRGQTRKGGGSKLAVT